MLLEHKNTPFTNTFLMKYSVFTAFFTSFLFFSSCAKRSEITFPSPKQALSNVEQNERNAPDIPDLSYLPDLPNLPSETPSPYWDVSDVDISDVDTSRKLISFTFDDAPARSLERILAVFSNFNENNPDCVATATVFCNGHFINPSSAQTLFTAYAVGWELGNHTFSHADLPKLAPDVLRREIDDTDALLYEIDGKQKHLLRAPYGHIDDNVKNAANVPIIDWTIDTVDWTGVSADAIYNAVFSNAFSGAIVLMHDGYENTVVALKRLLPDLKKAGYQVVSVSKMAKAHQCPLKNGSVYIRARKKTV